MCWVLSPKFIFFTDQPTCSLWGWGTRLDVCLVHYSIQGHGDYGRHPWIFRKPIIHKLYMCSELLNNCALSLLKADDLKIILLNYEILEPDTIPSHYQCAPVSGLMYILFQQVVPVNFGTLQGNKVSELLNIRLISWLAGA